MRSFKKILSVVLCVVTVMSMLCMGVQAASYDPNQLVSVANSYVGSTWANRMCLNFVATMVQRTYGTAYSSAKCAYEYGSKYIDSTSQNNIPLGADVFFTGSTSRCSNCGNKCGHIGIYVGNGQIVHAWDGKVVRSTIASITKSGTYRYRGWGWHGNMDFSGTSATVTLKTGTWLRLSNNKSGKLLNVYGSKNASNTNVTVYQQDGTSGQDFKLVAHGSMTYNGKSYTKYVVVPRCAGSCALNVYGNSSKNGSNVNIWTKSGNSTQDWIFEPVGNSYVIRSANAPIWC